MLTLKPILLAGAVAATASFGVPRAARADHVHSADCGHPYDASYGYGSASYPASYGPYAPSYSYPSTTYAQPYSPQTYVPVYVPAPVYVPTYVAPRPVYRPRRYHVIRRRPVYVAPVRFSAPALRWGVRFTWP